MPDLALMSAVLYSTVTDWNGGGERLTVKVALVRPDLPSNSVTSLMDRAGGMTVVTVVAALLFVLASASARPTEARFVIEPTVLATPTIVMLALPPAARLPRLKFSVPPPLACGP